MFKKYFNKNSNESLKLLNKYDKCYYCNKNISSKQEMKKHIIECKNKTIICELCNKKFTYLEHSKHWMSCTHKYWSYSYGPALLNNKFKKCCINKYNDKYPNKILHEIPFSELPKYQKDNMFYVKGIDKSKMLSTYRNNKKINQILCDLVNSL